MVDRVENTDAVAPQTLKPPRRNRSSLKISVPVDVLEATTFFQSVESGATN
jgi:hypothetical protein